MIPPTVALTIQAAAIALLGVFFRPWSLDFVTEGGQVRLQPSSSPR